MSPTPNGTDAKDIALYFIKITNTRATGQIIAKTINQAKSLLSADYTKEEIIQVIDHLILEKKYDVYSLGYISACINDALRDISKKKKQAQLDAQKEEIKRKIQEEQAKQVEVKDSDQSTKRNRDKAKRLGIQSRVREKFNFDMFEGQ